MIEPNQGRERPAEKETVRRGEFLPVASFARPRVRPVTPQTRPTRFDLTRIPVIKAVLKSRWLQWSLIALTLPFFVLAILAGFCGTPAGNRHFGIVFVWIVWWALVILLLVPFAGRLWCAMCPIPAPGDWLQRRALVLTPRHTSLPSAVCVSRRHQPRPGSKLYTLGLKWPKRLNNIWLQNISFLAVALFSAVILTSPFVSAAVLVALLACILNWPRSRCV